jgi:hypothetical protein
LRSKDTLISRLEHELRSSKKFHEEKYEQHVHTSNTDVDQLYAEVRTLKRSNDDKDDQVGARFRSVLVVDVPLVNHTNIDDYFLSLLSRLFNMRRARGFRRFFVDVYIALEIYQRTD